MDIKKRRAKMESQIIMGGIILVVVACLLFAILGGRNILGNTGDGDGDPEATAVPTLSIQTKQSYIPTPTNTPLVVVTPEPPTETPTQQLVTIDPEDPNTPEKPFLYEVQAGDSAFQVAQNFGVDFMLLLSVNDMSAETVIYPGDYLIIPDPSMEIATPTQTPTRVQALMVAQGDYNGVVLRDAPDGNIITTYLNYTLVEILPDEAVVISGRTWSRVLVLQDNQTGWILETLLVTATPAP